MGKRDTGECATVQVYSLKGLEITPFSPNEANALQRKTPHKNHPSYAQSI